MSMTRTRRGVLKAAPVAAVTIGATSVLGATNSESASGNEMAARASSGLIGVVGNGVVDDGPALRSILGTAGPSGALFRLPKGRFLLSGKLGAGAGLDLTSPVSLIGDGAVLSVLQPAVGAADMDCIRLHPNASYDHSGLRLSGFALHDPTNGKRAGRHGIVIDTTANRQNLAGVLLEDLIIGQGRGWAIVHDNDPSRNPNGGFWASTIARNQLKGGLRLNGSGDNLRIEDNIISGSNTGIDVALVAGASCMAVERCNITSAGGAIRHRAGHRCVYRGLNIEHFTVGARANNDGAVVNIAGETSPVVGGCLVDSLVSAFGNSDATHLIRIANTRGFTIERLTLLTGLRRSIVALEIASSAYDTRVGTLQMQAGDEGAFAMAIIDRGVGTMGVVKDATLESGWGRLADLAPLRFLKSFDGMVRLWGTVAGDPLKNSNRIATLPPRFRPDETVRLPVLAIVDARPVSAEVSLAPDGVLTVDHVDEPAQISLNATFAATGLGHAVSPE